MADTDTISPVYARFVLRELERRQLDCAPLFAGLTLTRDTLCRGADDLAFEDFRQILIAGSRLLEDEALGLTIGAHANAMALGEVGVAMAVAPTVREGLQVLESFTRLHTSYVKVGLSSRSDGLAVTMSFTQNLGGTERFHIESASLLLQNYVETLTGQDQYAMEYRMAMPRPASTSVYARILHGPVTFSAPRSTVLLPRACLDEVSPYFHGRLWRESQRNLAARLNDLVAAEGRPFTTHVAGLLRGSEPPLPDLADVAGRLHVSQRTLNRRLQREGSNFRELKSEALSNWACSCLRTTGDSVEAIASALGYLEVANFRRAFRRSVGCSPSEYRRRGENQREG